MSIAFDANTLSREELDQISQLIYKKTVMLDKNYFQNNDDMMKFIRRVALKSENRESFWRRLLRKLDSVPAPSLNPQSVPLPSNLRDADIFHWFLKNLKRLHSLLGTLTARGTDNVFLAKLTDALHIAAHCVHISTLTIPQLNLLRELHTAFFTRSSTSNQNNLHSSSNINTNTSSNSSLVPVKSTSPPSFLPSSSRSYSGPNSGPPSGPMPHPVSSIPSHGRVHAISVNSQVQDYGEEERKKEESDWISNVYKKITILHRSLQSEGCRADGSVALNSDVKELLSELIDMITDGKGMTKDPGSLIGDSSVTGNALNGFLSILKRFHARIIQREDTKVTDESLNCEESMKESDNSDQMKDMERMNSSNEGYISSLNLLQMALISICLGKYSISNEDKLSDNQIDGMKRKRSSFMIAFAESDESISSLGIYPMKRKQYLGILK